jgi:hypothetical protein
MIWNEHSNLKGKHSFLSPSRAAWENYPIEKLVKVYESSLAKDRGTVIHELAARDILIGQTLGFRRPDDGTTYNMYVNDGIDYRMDPERVLYFSDKAFGTADTISFEDGILRIHDLKTGKTPAHMIQLERYAALFCLEYGYDPVDIQIRLQLYQSNEVIAEDPDPELISRHMDNYVHKSKVLEDSFRTERKWRELCSMISTN